MFYRTTFSRRGDRVCCRCGQRNVARVEPRLLRRKGEHRCQSLTTCRIFQYFVDRHSELRLHPSLHPSRIALSFSDAFLIRDHSLSKAQSGFIRPLTVPMQSRSISALVHFYLCVREGGQRRKNAPHAQQPRCIKRYSWIDCLQTSGIFLDKPAHTLKLVPVVLSLFELGHHLPLPILNSAVDDFLLAFQPWKLGLSGTSYSPLE